MKSIELFFCCDVFLDVPDCQGKRIRFIANEGDYNEKRDF